MKYRTTYIILGCFFVCLTGFNTYVSWSSDHFHIFSVSGPATFIVIAFCQAYLAPQMAQQDERSKLIREKAMFYSYFAIVFYLIVLMGLILFHIISVDALFVIALMMFLIVSTVFISMVVVSKIY